MVNYSTDFQIFIISKIKNITFFTLTSIFLSASSCAKEEQTTIPKETIEEPIIELPSLPSVSQPIYEGPTGNVWVYKNNKIDNGYVLVNDASDNRVYLMTKEAKVVYEWNLPAGIGNDAELMDDGRLLVSLNAENVFYDIGGYAGRIQLINPDRSVAWDYLYSSQESISHHDVEMLPDGNILFLAWQKKTKQEALLAGYDGSPDNEILLPESIIEINPETDQIEWEWHAWDHLIQDIDSTKSNYGSISDNPQKIDINYYDDERGDLMHANGLDYDPNRDLIFLSVNFYSEVWVLDHSTTKTEAALETGGNYNKGGSLIYRFGNPTAYKNNKGNRLFFNNHFPNILKNNEIGAGNILIYMNGNDGSEQSRIYELDMPDEFTLKPDTNNEPSILWEFTDSELYSPLVSGAVRLPNGNTLITEGRYGYWEVTNEGEVVWKFEGNKLFWRGYTYPIDHPGVKLLNLINLSD
ncbi:aryl-sulfate sulfotransferase [Maribacter luteus]|uniref:Arylsulfotransferase (ASST) n=1 Tax=Maribacter luteus TaxID=2594478 RepID=A0A6I2MM78_9FLAO|nr:aryl-sulfate sulfotransferase [Maribacter luteus]MRX63254.1 hypothetical protein [Maribacter luteus]